MTWDELATATPAQIDRLSKDIAKHCREADLDAAFSRYPGMNNRTTVVWTGVSDEMRVRNCLAAVANENFIQPYLSRVLEIGWAQEKFRSGVIAQMRGILRVALDPVALVDGMGKGLAIVFGSLPAQPKPGALGDPEMFRIVGERRDDIDRFTKGLLACEQLKFVHDSLHTLQVFGAGWLEEPDPADWPPADTLAVYAGRCRAAADAGRASTVIEPTILEELAKSSRITGKAEVDLASADMAVLTAAVASLRAELIVRQPVIDQAMFALCSELPFKALGELFAEAARTSPGQMELEAAAMSTGLLCEKLRSCMMAHGLWQSVDEKMYALEEMFGDGEMLSLDDIAGIDKNWEPCNRMLPLLLPDASESGSSFGMFRAAYSLLFLALDGASKGDQAAAAEAPRLLSDLSEAFVQLRLATRRSFYDADKELKGIVERLATLSQQMTSLRDRVPMIWRSML